MARYIDADKAKHEFNIWFGGVGHAVIANQVIDSIPTAKERYIMTEWIDVNERLPERDGKYLVARKDGNYYSISVRKFRKEVPCWYTGYCGHWERRTNGITHWMPLPEPPKERGDKE